LAESAQKAKRLAKYKDMSRLMLGFTVTYLDGILSDKDILEKEVGPGYV